MRVTRKKLSKKQRILNIIKQKFNVNWDSELGKWVRINDEPNDFEKVYRCYSKLT